MVHDSTGTGPPLTDGGSDDDDHEQRCDFCRLPVPTDPVTEAHGDVTYHFCSQACLDRSHDQDHAAAEYHGGWYTRPGVDALDESLPQGIPRNSFVLMSSQSGTRDEAVLAEIAWRALERGEPVVVVSFLDTPTSVAQAFVDLDWNVLPYLESGQLHILDCFTYRLEDPDRVEQRMSDWNTHLYSVTEQSTTRVEDPSNLTSVLNRLDRCLGARDMADTGVVFIDSLTELGSLVQPVKAYDFVKNVRAEVCKGRFVPVFASAALVTEEAEFPHDLGYMSDGVVDMRFDGETVPGTLLKQLRVRKMSGVLNIPEWHTYEYTAGQGMVVFDPEEEIAKSKARRNDAEVELKESEAAADEHDGESGGGDAGDDTTEASGDDTTEASGTDTTEASGDDDGDDAGEGSGDEAGEASGEDNGDDSGDDA